MPLVVSRQIGIERRAHVIAATALSYGLIADPTSRNIMLLVTLTMIAIPVLAKFGQSLTRSLRQRAYRQAIVLPNTFKAALLPFFADTPDDAVVARPL